ncbi:MAG: hypothetical protein HY951_10205 [Bacteroidia bacterium]|nr:hypothetical protein [Bacteroidia bacterium]
MTIISFGQTAFFENYNFNNGGYYIIGTYSESDRNSLKDSLGEFYTNDISILNQFKKDWVFDIPGKQYACGYHYDISVCKNGEIIESFAINLNCSEIVSRKGYFYFDSNKLRKFYGKLKTAYSKTIKFISLTEAREYRAKILLDSTLIMTPSPNWSEFEGEFDFTYKCKEGTTTCLEKEDSLKSVILQEISKTYPEEKFELSDRGGSLTEIDQIISCNKSLSDKFNLFYRDVEGYFGKWRPYSLSLETYWTIKQK